MIIETYMLKDAMDNYRSIQENYDGTTQLSSQAVNTMMLFWILSFIGFVYTLWHSIKNQRNNPCMIVIALLAWPIYWLV